VKNKGFYLPLGSTFTQKTGRRGVRIYFAPNFTRREGHIGLDPQLQFAPEHAQAYTISMPGSGNLPLHFHRERTQRLLDTRMEELLDKLRKNRPSEDPWQVRRAYEIASERHRDQLRRSGDPYMTHLLEVAHVLADMRMDATTLTAALLHDVVEDTEFPVSRIQERFGEETARLVEGVTKIGRLNMLAPETRQAENVRKMLLAMVHDVRVVVVKLADRLHNMRTIEFLPLEKQQRIFERFERTVSVRHFSGFGLDLWIVQQIVET